MGQSIKLTTTGTNAVGAIPDLANVANVIIPAGANVIFDSTVPGPVQTNVSNSGNLSINLSSAQTLPMSINGIGTVTILGSGIPTLTGNSSYTGNTILGSGKTLIAGSNNALGAGNIVSSGGTLGTSQGVVMPGLNVTGPITLISSIETAGAQIYNGALTIASTTTGLNVLSSSPAVNLNCSATVVCLRAQNSNIDFLGTVDAAGTKGNAQSLLVDAGTGRVILGDSVGSVKPLEKLYIKSRLYICSGRYFDCQ